MPEDGVLFGKDFAQRTADVVRAVESSPGGRQYLQSRRNHHGASGPGAILTVVHTPGTNTIDINQNGWLTVGGTENAFHIKEGTLENGGLSVPDTIEGVFFVCVHVLAKLLHTPEYDPPPPGPPPPAPPLPDLPILGIKFELVQNGSAAGSHYILRTPWQLGINGYNNADINEWRIEGYYESLVPIALIKVVAPVAPSTIPTITTSMMRRDDFVANLARLAVPRPYGWSGIAGGGSVTLQAMAGWFYSTDNTGRVGAAAATAVHVAVGSQPFDGYMVFRWSKDASVTPSFVAVSKADFATDYGDGNDYNGYTLLRVVIGEGRVLDIAPSLPFGTYPDTRTTVDLSYSIDDLRNKFNMLTGVVNQLAAEVNAQHGTSIKDNSANADDVPTIAFKNGIMQTIV